MEFDYYPVGTRAWAVTTDEEVVRVRVTGVTIEITEAYDRDSEPNVTIYHKLETDDYHPWDGEMFDEHMDKSRIHRTKKKAAAEAAEQKILRHHRLRG